MTQNRGSEDGTDWREAILTHGPHMIFGLVWGLFSRPIPLVPDRAALVVAPQGPLVEQLTGDPLERAVAESLRRRPSETLLRDLTDSIRALWFVKEGNAQAAITRLMEEQHKAMILEVKRGLYAPAEEYATVEDLSLDEIVLAYLAARAVK